MMHSKRNMYILVFVAVLVVLGSLWGPERLATYQDEKSLNQVKVQTQLSN